MSVIHKISEHISSWIIEKAEVTDDYKVTVTQYAIERFINISLFIVILVINIVVISLVYTNIVIECISILLIFLSMRFNFGGLHLKKDWQCIILSVIIPVITAIISTLIHLNMIGILVIYTFTVLAILIKGVVDSPNKVLSEFRKRFLFKRGLITYSVIFIANMILYTCNCVNISNCISIGIAISAINLLVNNNKRLNNLNI